MTKITPVILCGGVGTRLWPLSRVQHPKQFQPIDGEGSLTFFQSTIQRHRHPELADPAVCVNSAYLEATRQQLRELQCESHILAEPVSRNTGPAVLCAALHLRRLDADAMLLVLPSDHVIRGDLNAVVLQMRPAADQGFVVCFGITPSYPETGYGYIVDGGSHPEHPGMHLVSQFIEKPCLELASALVRQGDAYWASGISLFRADILIEEYRRLDPLTATAVEAALDKAVCSGGEMLLDGGEYARAAGEPTERAVFERSGRIALAPADVTWNDVGAWAAFHEVAEKNGDGNVESGDVLMIDCHNSYVRSSSRLTAVVGLDNVIVVDTEDALLVTNRDNSQHVKALVEELTVRNRPEVLNYPEHGSGSGQALMEKAGYVTSLITVEPGRVALLTDGIGDRRLLTIVEGQALVRCGGETRSCPAGTTIEIAPGENASIFNDGTTLLNVLQVACAAPVPDDPIAAAGDSAASPPPRKAYA